MEYRDFLTTWGIVERARLFDTDWVLSSSWLKVTVGTWTNPWNYGDVSCRSLNLHTRETNERTVISERRRGADLTCPRLV